MDEKTKQQLMIALMFFNVTLMGYMFYWFLFVAEGNITFAQVFTHIGIGAGIALVPGIVGFFVGGMMNK